jgi:hypothetical protein
MDDETNIIIIDAITNQKYTINDVVSFFTFKEIIFQEIETSICYLFRLQFIANNKRRITQINIVPYGEITEEYKTSIQSIESNADFDKLYPRVFRMHITANHIDSLDFENAKQSLKIIEQRLMEKCPEMSLSLNYQYNLPGEIYSYYNRPFYLLLCLYFNGDCISSISIHIHRIIGNIIILEISSQTKETYENRKYNKLLRAVLIMIMDDIKIQNTTIAYLYSNAETPISAWLLHNSFNGEIQNDDFNASNKIVTYKMIEDYISSTRNIEILIDLYDKETISKATRVFDELLSNEFDKQLICATLERSLKRRGGKTRRFKNNKKQRFSNRRSYKSLIKQR